MKRIFLILIIFSNNSFSQNLINNSSFENFTQCPTLPGQIDYATYWFQPLITGGSTDYFNKKCPTIFSFSNPRTGSGVAGILCFWGSSSNWREYIEGSLTNSLESNKTYCVSFNVKLLSFSNYAIDCMGAFFSKDSVRYYASMLCDSVPQILNLPNSYIYDTLIWTKIQGQFIAKGGEKFITIGNFQNDLNTHFITLSQPNNRAYYWIDDVAVYDCNTPIHMAEAGNDISICTGDSIQIGDTSRAEYIYWWIPSTGLSNDSIANPRASPTATTTYYLHQKDFKFDETVDSVTVYVYPALPDNAAGKDTLICAGGQAKLGILPGVYNYNWQYSADLSDTAVANPTAMPQETSTYVLTISNTGCSKTDSVTVSVEPCDTAENSFTIVNAFTPNGDGKNDLFKVKGTNISSVHMKILNRWGQLLFEATSKNPGWDGIYNGQVVNPGVYYYVIEVSFDNGEVRNKAGSIHLIR